MIFAVVGRSGARMPPQPKERTVSGPYVLRFVVVVLGPLSPMGIESDWWNILVFVGGIGRMFVRLRLLLSALGIHGCGSGGYRLNRIFEVGTGGVVGAGMGVEDHEVAGVGESQDAAGSSFVVAKVKSHAFQFQISIEFMAVQK
jgi:hypothetical protein